LAASLASIRVLLVDDFKPWRDRIVLMLRTRPELRLVGEASEGLEAVRMAGELQPDLILLDINLPKLNGIEAARRIRDQVPESKILFLSQLDFSELIEEALGTGALGYVVKAWAGRGLLPAIDAVMRGEQFVTGGLVGYPVGA
jgi:DNA-binding NarL/FixJ family response regulator